MVEILQNAIPYAAEFDAALPGIAPLACDGWIVKDDAFGAQMAERDRLMAQSTNLVHADIGASAAAKADVLGEVLAIITSREGYVVTSAYVKRPDGATIPLQGDCLFVAAQLIQEDLCLHEKRGHEHVLTAAVMCFPASWTMSEKIGRPLSAIHHTVSQYDENLRKRVQRLFDGVQAGRPLWRYNMMRYRSPDLFHPRREAAPRQSDDDFGGGDYLRSEHQALVRLPNSHAVLFAIHTYLIRDQGK
tara:strand:- start:2537 stop:3274 length:738 start_codon:yes stop_codon:yes gene_type:complete